MKQLPFFFILFLWRTLLMGQSPDTTFISVSQENGLLEKQQLVSAYDQAFGTMEPARWLFALNLAPITSRSDDWSRISAEVKLGPAISLHSSYGFGYEHAPANVYQPAYSKANHRIGLEPRWYYALPRRIRQGKSANNMSGDYIGLESVYQRSRGTFVEDFVIEQTSLAIRYGVQRRLFRYGFLDIGIGVGITKERTSSQGVVHPGAWRMLANSQIGLGLALARPKTTTTAGGYCDVLRCFREERQMWKIDLYNLLRVNSLYDYRLELSLGYEHKIGASPFSMQVQGDWSNGNTAPIYTEKRITAHSADNNNYSGSLQARYYYLQSRQIAKGRAGNNLSGPYAGTQCRWLEARSRYPSHIYGPIGIEPDIFGRGKRRDTSVGLICGIQHRLFQHGFIDFQVAGAQHQVKSNVKWTSGSDGTTTIERKFNVALNLRAGLAF